jgi:hypothetical protein
MLTELLASVRQWIASWPYPRVTRSNADAAPAINVKAKKEKVE